MSNIDLVWIRSELKGINVVLDVLSLGCDLDQVFKDVSLQLSSLCFVELGISLCYKICQKLFLAFSIVFCAEVYGQSNWIVIYFFHVSMINK